MELVGNGRVRKIRKKVEKMLPAGRRRRSRRQRITAFAAGAVVAFLFDPKRGRARRRKAVDRVAGALRRGARRTERARRHLASDARGLARRVAAQGDGGSPENDAVLVDKVRSEVLGNPELPEARVNVNVEDGVVVLRGQMKRPKQIRRIEKAVRQVDGVRDVENLLHLPGTPAPSSRGRVRAG